MRTSFNVGRGSILCVAAVVAAAGSAMASLTVLPSGPMVGTHAGNLVTNGSFEFRNGGLPGPGGAINPLWATGSIGGPVAVPMGWTSSGGPSAYANWGSDGAPSPRHHSSDVLPHGVNALYFGNGQTAFATSVPTFLPNGEVLMATTPGASAPFAVPVVLSQVVPTHLTPASSYVLSMWLSGEGSGGGGAFDGIFGLRVTNTQLGDPMRYFVVPGGASAFGASLRLEFSFTPINASLPVMIEFTNFGHFNLSPFGLGGTTELVLDDVIINAVPGPGVGAILAMGGLLASRRRR